MNVQMPDGTVVTGVPEGTTQEELLRRYQGMATNLAQKPDGTFLDKLVSVGESAKAALSPSAGAGGAIVQAMGRGLSALGMPALETAYTNLTNKREADLAALREKAGLSGTDVTRAAMTPLNPSNLATLPMFGGPAASLVGRAAQGAGIAGSQAALTPTRNDGNYLANKATDVGIGAGLGFLATPAMEGVIRAAGAAAAPLMRMARDRMSGQNAAQVNATIQQSLADQLETQGVKWADLSDNVRADLTARARDALAGGKGLTLNAQAAQRAADFERAGIRPTAGQITRDPVQFTWEKNKRGVIDDLTTRFNEQGSQISQMLRNVQESSGPQMGKFDAGKEILGELNKIDFNMQAQVSRAYKAFRDSTGATIDVPLMPVAQRVGEILDTFGADNVPGAVMSRLSSYGLVKRDGMHGGPWVAGGKQTKVFDLLEADKLLKTINANYDPMKGPQNAAMASLRKSINEAIDGIQIPEGNATADLGRAAVAAARERFGLIDRTEGLRAAVRNSVDPEDFVRKFVQNGSVQDLENLMAMLPTRTQDIIRRQVMGVIAGRAMNKEADAGLQQVTHAGMKAAREMFGADRMERMFPQGTRDQLGLIERLTGYTQVAPEGGYVNTSNTAVEGLRAGLGLLGRIPGAPLVLKGADWAQNTMRSSAALNPAAPAIAEPLSPELRGLLAKRLGLAAGAFTPEMLTQ